MTIDDELDRIFTRLAGLYGARFSDMWAGTDAEHVRAAWLSGIQRLSAPEIDAGLQFCIQRPFPPTLPEFVQMCRANGNARTTMAPLPKRGEDPGAEKARAACMALVSKIATDKPRGLNWAEKLRDLHASGGRLSVMQREMYQAALGRHQGSGQTASTGTPGTIHRPFS